MVNKRLNYGVSTTQMQELKDIGYDLLSDISSEIKNQNIYPLGTIQHDLWNEFATKNLPFLVVLSNHLYEISTNHSINKILFTTRDCVFLQRLFSILYASKNSEIMYSSRALLLFPTNEYVDYCMKILLSDSLVVDFQGTGQSFMSLVSKLGVEPWYFLVNWNYKDRASYSSVYLHDYHKKIILRSKNYFDDIIEKLNIDLVGTYFDYYDNKPISFEYEYDKKIIISLHECFNAFINSSSLDLAKLRTYRWNNDFDSWMNHHYINSAAINSLKWISTHFKYDAHNINTIRSVMRNNAKNS